MTRTPQSTEYILARIERDERLDGVAGSLAGWVERVIPEGSLRDLLHGVWLGHPLHPMLTDLPIGAWTTAWILDLVGGERAAPTAQMFVGFGCLSALPTAVSGAVDWSQAGTSAKRVGLVHGLANSVALALYSWSWWERRRGRRTVGIALGFGGATAATVGGYLGGHLAFRRAVGANRVGGIEAPAEWSDASPVSNQRPRAGDTQLIEFEGDELLVVAELGAAIAARCTHEGGPLGDGELVGVGRDRCVVCPWHGSTFRFENGAVVRGPATSPQPAFDARPHLGGWQVRARRLCALLGRP
jgi:nitrite reductase/ring-hydroxylating ferredoxin subunit/uncharacterized membrane protein